MSEAPYETGVYVKGDDERVANTPARAVALAFEGYVLKTESIEESAAPTAAPVTETAPVQDTTPTQTALVRREPQENDDQ